MYKKNDDIRHFMKNNVLSSRLAEVLDVSNKPPRNLEDQIMANKQSTQNKNPRLAQCQPENSIKKEVLYYLIKYTLVFCEEMSLM